eukprot:Polyplicarium_translucidae@DN2889_c0_g1_i5.p1
MKLSRTPILLPLCAEIGFISRNIAAFARESPWLLTADDLPPSVIVLNEGTQVLFDKEVNQFYLELDSNNYRCRSHDSNTGHRRYLQSMNDVSPSAIECRLTIGFLIARWLGLLTWIFHPKRGRLTWAAFGIFWLAYVTVGALSFSIISMEVTDCLEWSALAEGPTHILQMQVALWAANGGCLALFLVFIAVWKFCRWRFHCVGHGTALAAARWIFCLLPIGFGFVPVTVVMFIGIMKPWIITIWATIIFVGTEARSTERSEMVHRIVCQNPSDRVTTTTTPSTTHVAPRRWGSSAQGPPVLLRRVEGSSAMYKLHNAPDPDGDCAIVVVPCEQTASVRWNSMATEVDEIPVENPHRDRAPPWHRVAVFISHLRTSTQESEQTSSTDLTRSSRLGSWSSSTTREIVGAQFLVANEEVTDSPSDITSESSDVPRCPRVANRCVQTSHTPCRSVSCPKEGTAVDSRCLVARIESTASSMGGSCPLCFEGEAIVIALPCGHALGCCNCAEAWLSSFERKCAREQNRRRRSQAINVTGGRPRRDEELVGGSLVAAAPPPSAPNGRAFCCPLCRGEVESLVRIAGPVLAGVVVEGVRVWEKV